jgi:hypothetical protein
MGTEEVIRRQKADALFDVHEAEERALQAAIAARAWANGIEEFAKLLRPDSVPGKTGAAAIQGLNVTALRGDKFRTVLNHESAIEVAEQLQCALSQLAEARTKKTELGLR